MNIMQGDQYALTFSIESDEGEILNTDSIDKLRATFGSIQKTYPGEIYCADSIWYMPLTQEETFALSDFQPLEIRVHLASADSIIGADMGLINVKDSIDKVVF